MDLLGVLQSLDNEKKGKHERILRFYRVYLRHNLLQLSCCAIDNDI
jgi:hypothetical protein